MKNIQDQIWIQIKMHFLSKENIITGEKYNENWNPSLKFECTEPEIRFLDRLQRGKYVF